MLAGLFVILWGATWLERLVAPPDLDPMREMAKGIERELAPSSARPEVFSVDGTLGAELATTNP